MHFFDSYFLTIFLCNFRAQEQAGRLRGQVKREEKIVPDHNRDNSDLDNDYIQDISEPEDNTAVDISPNTSAKYSSPSKTKSEDIQTVDLSQLGDLFSQEYPQLNSSSQENSSSHVFAKKSIPTTSSQQQQQLQQQLFIARVPSPRRCLWACPAGPRRVKPAFPAPACLPPPARFPPASIMGRVVTAFKGVNPATPPYSRPRP